RAPVQSGAFLCSGDPILISDPSRRWRNRKLRDGPHTVRLDLAFLSRARYALSEGITSRTPPAVIFHERQRRGREKEHRAQTASRSRPAGARDGPALDRPGHRRNRLASIELHDQPAAV